MRVSACLDQLPTMRGRILAHGADHDVVAPRTGFGLRRDQGLHHSPRVRVSRSSQANKVAMVNASRAAARADSEPGSWSGLLVVY